jgi:hypothetical protein
MARRRRGASCRAIGGRRSRGYLGVACWWNFEIPLSELEAKSVSDPVESVRVDVDVILQAIHGTAFLVSGLVYDVDTGLIDVVVPPTPLSLA